MINDDIRRKAAKCYSNMMERCYNPNNAEAKNYYERGIKVDDMWFFDPTSFFDWYLNNYFEGGQIDRINVNGPYSPSNCRMATAKENSRNKRETILVTAFGETKPMSDWAEDSRCVVSYTTLRQRIQRNIDPETSITSPTGTIKGIYRKS